MTDILDKDRNLQARGNRRAPSVVRPLARDREPRAKPRPPPRGFLDAIRAKLRTATTR